MRNLTLAQAARDAVHLCAACGADGIVRISVTRNPEGSIRRRPNLVAAQWAWVGSESRAKLLVRRLRRQWLNATLSGRATASTTPSMVLSSGTGSTKHSSTWCAALPDGRSSGLSPFGYCGQPLPDLRQQ